MSKTSDFFTMYALVNPAKSIHIDTIKSHKANFFALTDFILKFRFAKIIDALFIIVYLISMKSEQLADR